MLWSYDHKAIGWFGRALVDLRVPVRPGQMLALVDSLHAGTLNEFQREAAQALRTGILALVEQDIDKI
jgi:hypothetical protein